VRPQSPGRRTPSPLIRGSGGKGAGKREGKRGKRTFKGNAKGGSFIFEFQPTQITKESKGKAPSGTSDRPICFQFLKGSRTFKEKCQYFHPLVCKSFSQGISCPRGKECSELHVRRPRREGPSINVVSPKQQNDNECSECDDCCIHSETSCTTIGSDYAENSDADDIPQIMINAAYRKNIDGLPSAYCDVAYSAYMTMYNPKDYIEDNDLCQVCDPQLQDEDIGEAGLVDVQLDEVLSDSESEAWLSKLIAVSNNLDDDDTHCDPQLQDEDIGEDGLVDVQHDEVLSDSESEAWLSKLIALSSNLDDDDTHCYQADQSSSEAESDTEDFYSIPDPNEFYDADNGVGGEIPVHHPSSITENVSATSIITNPGIAFSCESNNQGGGDCEADTNSNDSDEENQFVPEIHAEWRKLNVVSRSIHGCVYTVSPCDKPNPKKPLSILKQSQEANRRRRHHTVRFKWFLHKISEKHNENPSVKRILDNVTGKRWSNPDVDGKHHVDVVQRLNPEEIRKDEHNSMTVALNWHNSIHPPVQWNDFFIRGIRKLPNTSSLKANAKDSNCSNLGIVNGDNKLNENTQLCSSVRRSNIPAKDEHLESANVVTPRKRRFVLDSGASFHLICESSLSDKSN
jgi:hypothetical protein